MPVKTKTQEEIPMNVTVPYTPSRRAMIATTKTLLTNPENKKPGRNSYGNKLPRLFFRDYLIYAVLRGRDYRKACHESSLEWAVSELKYLLNAVTSVAADSGSYYAKQVARYIPQEGADLDELKGLLEEALKSIEA
jgi:hypothetical protein